METIAVLGAGDLGAGIARRAAEAELARRIVLVDPDTGLARGKALDLAQGAPVERFDVVLEARAELEELAADVVVLADYVPLVDGRPQPYLGRDFYKSLAARVGKGLLLAAGAEAVAVDAAVQAGLPRERVLGSAPLAAAGALRRGVADELGLPAGQVGLTLLGMPPDLWVVPRASVTAAGIGVEALSATALRRSLARACRRWPPGQVALATAAVAVLRALASGTPAVLPLFVRLLGEYGHRGAALAVPARLGASGLRAIVEVPLEPVERVTLDNAAERQLAVQL